MITAASVKDVVRILDGLAPLETAEAWDNVGLLVGRQDAPVRRVLVTLDVTPEIVREAVAKDAQMIVSHHPLMFRARSRMTDADPEGQTLLALCEQGIALCSLHTNLDKAAGGVNDALMRAIGLTEVHGEGFLRTARLPEGTTAETLAAHVANALDAQVRLYGRRDGTLQTIACSCGAGGDEALEAIAAGAQVLLTGEIKHHTALDAVARGLCVLEAGHYHTEIPVVKSLAEALQNACDALQYHISVFCAQTKPF